MTAFVAIIQCKQTGIANIWIWKERTDQENKLPLLVQVKLSLNNDLAITTWNCEFILYIISIKLL